MSVVADVNNSEKLFILMKKYLQMIPVSELDLNIILNECDSIEIQKAILEYSVNNMLLQTYAGCYKYKRAFLKALINELEHCNCDIMEEIYNDYTELLSKPEFEHDYVHTLYLLPDTTTLCKLDAANKHTFVVIKETQQIISSGTTGLKTWLAGKVMVNLLQHFAILPDVKNKCVLELGSGTGLLGVMLCKLHHPRSYVFTDSHQSVLELLSSNIEMNSDCQWVGDEVHTINGSLVNVHHLDWTNWVDDEHPTVSQLIHRYGSPDIILATDVIYDGDLFPSLLQIIRHLLKVSPNTKVILATTVRNADTMSQFKQHVDSLELEYKIITVYDSTSKAVCEDPIVYLDNQTIATAGTVEIASISLKNID